MERERTSRRGRSAARTPIALGLVLLSLVALGCERASEPVELEQIARRLGSADFDVGDAPYHGAVAQIGDEARPVVVAPERIPVALGLGLLAEGGEVRLDVALPERARDLPAGSFAMSVQRFPMPARLPDSAFADFARTLFARQLERGWRLDRAPEDPARATLVYAPPPEDQTDPIGPVYFNLRLDALLPPPPRLASGPFAAPPGGHLELGYGLLVPAGAADVAPVRYAARIACGGGEETELFARTVDPRSESGWHDERFALPSSDAPCRLSLASEATAGGGPARGAVWAVPRVTEIDRGDDRNVVLVSLDTLRADHLSGYGYARPTSPTIDAELIGGGTTFTDVIATFPQTDAAHLSLFTGLYADAQPGRGRLAPSSPLPLLTERLRDAGLETAAFTEDALIAGSFGFWFGFDRFVERSFREHERGRATFDDGVRFVREHRDRRFFLFLHTYKTHDPYVASEAYQSLFTDGAEWEESPPAPEVPKRHRGRVDAYDRTVREADDLVSELLAALDEVGLAERTIVVVLSDHGESFGEHGATGHGFSGFQEQLWVPLVMRGPGIPAGLRIDAPASLVDVAPTLLEILGLDPLPAAQGISLAPALRGEAPPSDRPLYFAWLQDGAAGVRRGAWKYVRSDLEPTPKVYDLARDPAERNPLRDATEFHPVAETLLRDQRARSEGLRATLGHPDSSPPQPALTEHMERSLRALGYID
jgi:arylsulfatase A-like enzyme